MQTLARNMITRLLLVFALAFAAVQSSALAQDRPPATQQQLDQMLAPIALYPDALLSQILMAATYPLEVVQAARWSRSHSNLAGDDAVRAVEDEDWDPSVKSLVAFPQVLERMDENLQWTQSLGDAFLDQEPQVMDTVQNLRRRAEAAGNLRSNDRIRVDDSGQTVVVEYVNPEVIYVPYYDPMVVYGTWWWPAYRPVYWRPWPGYYAQPGFAFYWGPPIGISAGFFFGSFDWYHRQARVVQVNNYYYNTATRRDIISRAPGAVVVNRAPGIWQHDPTHRRGVAYRNVQVQQRFSGAAVPRDMNRRDTNQGGPVVTPNRANPAGRIDQRRPEAGPRPNAQPQPQIQSPAAVPGGNRDRDARPDHGDRNMRIDRRPETRGATTAPEINESRGRGIEMRREPDPARFRSQQPPVEIRGNAREERRQPEAPRVITPPPASMPRPQDERRFENRARPPAPPPMAAPQAPPPQAQPQAPAERKQEREDGPRNFHREKKDHD